MSDGEIMFYMIFLGFWPITIAMPLLILVIFLLW
jgi:hypothetical protein